MGDSSKTKNTSVQSTSRNSRSSSSNVASPIGTREFAPRPDLDAQILASISPVSSEKDLRTWLEKKGWPPNSEVITKSHLADILFSVYLAFKLPNEADTAIRSVAYILRNLSDINASDTLANNIVDQVAAKLNDTITSLNLAVTSAKNFLEATTQQQASDLISIKETLVQQDGLVKSLAEVVEKISAVPNPPGLANGNWPPLPQPGVPLASGGSAIVAMASHLSSPLNSKLLQPVSLMSKQVLIDYGPSNPDDPPRDKSIEAQRTFRGMFNNWIDISTPPAEEGAAPPPPTRAIRSVSIFDSPSVLLEFDSVDSKAKFEKICADKPEILSKFNLKARIRPRMYPIIMCFVPCSGHFDPGNNAHLKEVEAENDIPQIPSHRLPGASVWKLGPQTRNLRR